MAKQAGKSRVITIVVLEYRVVSGRCMSEDDSITFLDERLWNRVEVTRRYGSVAESDMALCTGKRRALVSLIDLVVKNSTIVERRCHMATFGAST